MLARSLINDNDTIENGTALIHIVRYANSIHTGLFIESLTDDIQRVNYFHFSFGKDTYIPDIQFRREDRNISYLEETRKHTLFGKTLPPISSQKAAEFCAELEKLAAQQEDLQHLLFGDRTILRYFVNKPVHSCHTRLVELLDLFNIEKRQTHWIDYFVNMEILALTEIIHKGENPAWDLISDSYVRCTVFCAMPLGCCIGSGSFAIFPEPVTNSIKQISIGGACVIAAKSSIKHNRNRTISAQSKSNTQSATEEESLEPSKGCLSGICSFFATFLNKAASKPNTTESNINIYDYESLK